MAPVTALAASCWTLFCKDESRLWQLFQITSPYSMSGLIRRLYKYVKVDLSTLYLTYFSIFNRLEAFLYILTIWFLLDILLCKVRPKWVWHSTSLTTLVSRSRGGWSCLLGLGENATLRDLTGFIVTNHLSTHSEILFRSELRRPADTAGSSTISNIVVSSA